MLLDQHRNNDSGSCSGPSPERSCSVAILHSVPTPRIRLLRCDVRSAEVQVTNDDLARVACRSPGVPARDRQALASGRQSATQ